MSELTPEPAEAKVRKRWHTVDGWLLLGYVLVLVAATFTVVIPELSKEPEPAPAGKTVPAQPAK